ncbi:hypothetical protein [Haloparvum sedimenti]|uniref:hypothetical protein n=1 Tax=Haloparvum sedimenti TaxID=1678448 RepID=UPI00071E6B67|nr:hypothetical protein [Haloparvum sedimenti]
MSPVPASIAWLLIGIAAGLIGAAVMAYPMSRDATGFVPARVATALVTRCRPADVPLPQALVFHGAAGAVTGAAYAALAAGFDRVLPAVGTLSGGIGFPAHLLAAALVTGAVYLVFAVAVFPYVGGRAYKERDTEVQGRWLRASLAFGAALAVTAPALASLLR